jgi:hypothetical protein
MQALYLLAIPVSLAPGGLTSTVRLQLRTKITLVGFMLYVQHDHSSFILRSRPKRRNS